MDSYNRLGGDVTKRGLNVEGSSIGNATLSASFGVNSAGFFAQSYNVADGTTIISYRGTDQIFTADGVGGDLVNGWVTGGGAYSSSQAQLAAQFYQQVNGDSASGNPNISLTGHSLGG